MNNSPYQASPSTGAMSNQLQENAETTGVATYRSESFQPNYLLAKKTKMTNRTNQKCLIAAGQALQQFHFIAEVCT